MHYLCWSLRLIQPSSGLKNRSSVRLRYLLSGCRGSRQQGTSWAFELPSVERVLHLAVEGGRTLHAADICKCFFFLVVRTWRTLWAASLPRLRHPGPPKATTCPALIPKAKKFRCTCSRGRKSEKKDKLWGIPAFRD